MDTENINTENKTILLLGIAVLVGVLTCSFTNFVLTLFAIVGTLILIEKLEKKKKKEKRKKFFHTFLEEVGLKDSDKFL